MALFSSDVIVATFSTPENRNIGSRSQYVDVEHPGTNKKIEGWKWDQRHWPTKQEFDAAGFAPSIWDPSTSGIETELFQSGFGDNEDLLLVEIVKVDHASGEHVWSPEVQHGYFYVNDEEWYLYSDAHLTDYFTITGLDGQGNEMLQLRHEPKIGIPIQVNSYKFDRVNSIYHIDRSFRKKVEFASGVSDQFVVDNSFDPPALIISGVFNDPIGSLITITSSGTADYDGVLALEQVGISQALPDQQFQLEFSPVDKSQPVEVLVYYYPDLPTEYSGIEITEDFLPGESAQVKIDYEAGFIRFGDYDSDTGLGSGKIPPATTKIAVHYTKGLEAKYEPKDSKDTHLAHNLQADVNAARAGTEAGFVQLTTSLLDPGSVVLSTDLPTGSPNFIYLGNNVGALIATVYDKQGNLIQGQEVFFEILDPKFGSLGGTAEEFNSVTDSDGQAHARFNAPTAVSDIGTATATISHSGADTIIDLDGRQLPDSVSGLYLYKIHESDVALGIPEANETSYYEDYLTDEGITSGIQATVGFEQEFRTAHSIDHLTTYDPTDLITGKKSLVITSKPLSANVIHPHSGVRVAGTFAPLYPSAIDDIGTDEEPAIRAVYSGILLDEPGTFDTKAYFGITEASTRVRAYALNRRSGQKIYSNILDLDIKISGDANGTYLLRSINDIPSGILGNAPHIDDISDDTILETSGEFYIEYLFTRSGSSELVGNFEPFGEDDDTVAYWKMDSLFDEVAGLELIPSGVNHLSLGPTITPDGVFDSAFESTTSGQLLFYGGPEIQVQASGTMDMLIKFKNIESVGRSGVSLDLSDFTLFIAGNDPRKQLIQLMAGNFTFGVDPPGADKFMAAHTIGNDTDYVTFDLENLSNNVWYELRYTWGMTATDGGSGILDHYLLLNRQVVGSSEDNVVTLPIAAPSGTLAPIYNVTSAIAAAPNAGLAVYDEFRLRNVLDAEAAAEPVIQSIFRGETYVDWFRRTHKADTRTLGLVDVLLNPSHYQSELPLGFRLKDSEHTLASLVDMVTYIDPNPHLTSGYYGF